MIYTLSRQGGIDFSPILPDLRKQDILDSDAFHEQQMQLDSHILEHFGEYSPQFRNFWARTKIIIFRFFGLACTALPPRIWALFMVTVRVLFFRNCPQS